LTLYASTAQTAVAYWERGWSPIPLKIRSKEPKLSKGHPFLSRRATEEEFRHFDFRHNVGIVAGRVSGLIVLDDDDNGETLKNNAWHVPATPTVKTKRGHQYYLRCPEAGFPTCDVVAGKLEVRGDGAYVVAPPSVHPSGDRYEWVISPDDAELAEAPAWLMDQASLRGRRMGAEDVGETIANGSRNKILFSLAGTLRRRGLDEAAIAAALLGINDTKCETPLPEDEVRKIAHSALRYEPEDPIEDGFIYFDHIDREFDRNKSGLPIKTVEEVIAESSEGPAWIIEDLLARGALTDFSGLAKKGGKTTFWMHAIAAGARGEDHGGYATQPAKYLYLTEQDSNFAQALTDSGLINHPDHIRIVQFKDVSAVGWDSLIREAGAETKRLGFDVLAVDTFAVFARMKGKQENDSGEVGDRLRVLRLVAQQYDLAALLIRHAGKDGTPRGSSAFEAEADICVIISRPEGRHDRTVRNLSGLGRYGEFERNVQLRGGHFISVGSDDRIEFNKAVRFVKAVLPDTPQDGMKKEAILDKRSGTDQELSAATVKRALQWLVKQGAVGEKQLMDHRGKPKVYWLAHNPPGGGNKSGDIYFDQTTFTSNVFDRNKSEGPQDAYASVEDLFLDPPDWLPRQLEKYREDPRRHFEPLCRAIGAVVLGDPARHAEVAEEVREAVDR
jgi:Bifunctional DNA primase/polymerase, N-terminal/Primase C terminal 1 (PriCT-1)/AAA domain